MSLAEQIIAEIEGSKTNDYQQRSALGMARSWLDTGDLALAVNSLDLKPNRDKLAVDIVALMADFGPEESVGALLEARKHVNAPYQQKSVHTGADLSKLKHRKPSEGKK